jgi:GAF domain-containing protein
MPLNTDDLERIVQIATAIEEHRKSAFATQQDFASLDAGITRISLPLQKNLADNFTFEQDELIQGIIDLLGDLLQVEKVSLMLIDHNKRELRIKAAKGLDPYVITNTTKALGEGIAGRVAQEGKPLLIKNVEENVEYSESPFFQQYSTKSLVCVPLKAGEMVVGVLSANNKYAGTPFDEHDLYMATIFSHLLLLTLQNAQLHFDRERFLTQESSLGALNRKIASSLEPRLLYHAILDECRKLIQADFAFLFELDEKGSRCGVHYLNGSELKEGMVPNGSFRQWLTNRSVPNLVFGSPDDSHFALLQSLTGKEFYAWCSVPIILQDRLAGSLEVSNETSRRFREGDKQFLLKVAHQASLAISNARLYVKLLDSLKEISQARKEVEKMRREQYN